MICRHWLCRHAGTFSFADQQAAMGKLGKLSSVMQVLKQRVSRRCRGKKKRSAKQMTLWENSPQPLAFWQT